MADLLMVIALISLVVAGAMVFAYPCRPSKDVTRLDSLSILSLGILGFVIGLIFWIAPLESNCPEVAQMFKWVITIASLSVIMAAVAIDRLVYKGRPKKT